MIVLDRIEGDRAILLVDGQTIDLPASVLPAGSKEGDVLRFAADPDATAARLNDAEARLARLRARSNQGSGSMDL